MTITQKRATLFREWILANLGNHENYYYSTICMGIPDGDDEQTVKEDITAGYYDDDIDETIDVYTQAKKRYAKYGYYIDGKVVNTEAEALAGFTIPTRIYKR